MKSFDVSRIDGYEALPRFEQTCCLKCKYFHGTEKGSCEAFPKGIPDKFAVRNVSAWMTIHLDIEPEQRGRFIFETE